MTGPAFLATKACSSRSMKKSSASRGDVPNFTKRISSSSSLLMIVWNGHSPSTRRSSVAPASLLIDFRWVTSYR
jgi:hypothetical protein